MAGQKTEPSTARTPVRPSAKPAGTVNSSSKQRSIMSFFQKSSPGPASSPTSRDKVSPDPQRSSCLQETTKANSLPKPRAKPPSKPLVKLSTPVPSSDVIESPSSQENADPVPTVKSTTRSNAKRSHDKKPSAVIASSPSRKVRLYEACVIMCCLQKTTSENPCPFNSITHARLPSGQEGCFVC